MTKFNVRVYENGYISESPSVPELESLESWMQKQLSIEADASWHSCIANMYLMANTWYEDPDNELLKVVIGRSDNAIRLDPKAWKAHLMTGDAYFRFKGYRECLEVLVPAIEQKSDTSTPGNDNYRWSLAGKIGECYAKLSELENAVNWYQRVFDHVIKKRTRNGDFSDIVSKLLGALLEQTKYEAAFALLQRLDETFDNPDNSDNANKLTSAEHASRSDEPRSWLMIIISEPCEFHKHIIALAQQPDKFGLLDEFYQRASRSVSDDDTNSNLIRFNQWRLHWYLGTLDQQDLALNGWESLVSLTSGNRYGHWPTWVSSVQEILNGISRRAAQDRMRSMPIQTHLARLERIKVEIENTGAESLVHATQRVQARLHHLSGETRKARDLLCSQLQWAFTSTDDADSFTDGAKNLAYILPIIDDDINAVAAWRLLEPKRTAASNTGNAELSGSEDADQVPSENTAAAGINTTTPDQQAVVGAQDPVVELASLPSSNGNEVESEFEHSECLQETESSAASAESTTEEDQSTSTATLKGDVDFYCDGGCGHDWTFTDNMYICKDCVDVQFDEKCFKKLKDGKLGITVCSPSHSHLHVPPFDVDAWKRRKPEEMVVGDQIVLRSEWLNKLKHDWADVVRPGTTRALVVVQRRWLRILKARERMAMNRGL